LETLKRKDPEFGDFRHRTLPEKAEKSKKYGGGQYSKEHKKPQKWAPLNPGKKGALPGHYPGDTLR